MFPQIESNQRLVVTSAALIISQRYYYLKRPGQYQKLLSGNIDLTWRIIMTSTVFVAVVGHLVLVDIGKAAIYLPLSGILIKLVGGKMT